jgi:predicted nucleic-acid-binding Zn-ribbon protein
MRKTHRCPKCQGRKLWHIEQMSERNGHNQLGPIAVAFHQSWLGLGAQQQGSFETYICKACGFTEWYAQGFEELREDPERGVRSIGDGDDDQGPYR